MKLDEYYGLHRVADQRSSIHVEGMTGSSTLQKGSTYTLQNAKSVRASADIEADSEMLVQVHMLHLDATSMAQVCAATLLLLLL
tara:strand:+ start:183 stop:434 length:252 start_codon:yes stop_codon:yes gene_type:complete